MTLGVFEILVVDIYIMKKHASPSLKQDDFRWNLIMGMVSKPDEWDAERKAALERRERRHPATPQIEESQVDVDKLTIPFQIISKTPTHITLIRFTST